MISDSAGTVYRGDAGKDRIHASGFADAIDGGPDDDLIEAMAGDDSIDGGDGGDGADTVTAGEATTSSPAARVTTPSAATRAPTVATAARGPTHATAALPARQRTNDPDQCAAESMSSCRGGVVALPDKWQLKVTATTTEQYGDHREVAVWSIDAVLKRGGDPATTSFYVSESGSGSYRVEGSRSCSWSGSGTWELEDLEIDLGLVPDANQYFLNISPVGDDDVTYSCNGETWVDGAQWTHYFTSDGSLPWDRGTAEIRGSASVEGVADERIDVQWVFTPLG